VLLVLLAGCAGTSSKASTPAALKLEREDLAAASRVLETVRAPVAREVAATKAAWPLIAGGLPAQIGGLSSSSALDGATASAAQLPIPALFSEANARTLTGPASQLAGLYRSYALLSRRGWKLLAGSLTQIESGTPSAARFARANAGLYIESIYDAHFTLAQLGKKLTAGYEKLGGSADFGAALTQARVEQLARAYSEASDRLHPHVAARLGS
jgi:hypothetical protein